MKNKIIRLRALLGTFIIALPLSMCLVAFAEEAPKLPIIPVEPGHWWSGLVSVILTAAITGLTALVGWLTNNIKTWFAQKSSKENTLESAAWYATAIYLAKIAVGYAKNKYGPETANAAEIIVVAKQWLKERLTAIDKDIVDPAKNPNLDNPLDGLIHAVYNLPFEVVSPLVAGPASTQP